MGMGGDGGGVDLIEIQLSKFKKQSNDRKNNEKWRRISYSLFSIGSLTVFDKWNNQLKKKKTTRVKKRLSFE